MGHNQIDISCGKPRTRQHLGRGIGHDACGKPEDGLAIHADVVIAIVYSFERGGQRRAARLQGKRICARAIAAQLHGKDATGDIACRNQQRARAIAKEHAGRAIRPVDKAAERLCANHQNVFDIAGKDHAARHAQAIDKARTGRAQVIRAGVGRANQVLDDARRTWKDMFRRTGGADDQPHFGCRHVRHFQRLARSGSAECRAGLLGVGSNVTLLDARARADPLVRRVDNRFEVLVGDHLLGHLHAPTHNLRIAAILVSVVDLSRFVDSGVRSRRVKLMLAIDSSVAICGSGAICG